MKSLTALSFFLLIVSNACLGQDSAKVINDTPSYYMTMRKGKLIEYNENRHRIITQDRTLTDGTTIHPNGSIDLGSGQSHQLKSSEYLTMDGQIRKMKTMGKKKKGKWVPNKSSQ